MQQVKPVKPEYQALKLQQKREKNQIHSTRKCLELEDQMIGVTLERTVPSVLTHSREEKSLKQYNFRIR